MFKNETKVCTSIYSSLLRIELSNTLLSAVAMGSVAQYRILGSAIGLAIVTAAFNGLVRGKLEDILPSGQVDDLLRSPAAVKVFANDLQPMILAAFGEGYNLQLKILAGLAALQIPSALLIWKRQQIVA